MVVPKDCRLGVHHHSPFHVDKDGNVFIISFIGLWLDALSLYWKEVVYIGYSTPERMQSQDYKVNNLSNISFVSAGHPGGISTIVRRVSSVKKAMKKASPEIELHFWRVGF